MTIAAVRHDQAAPRREAERRGLDIPERVRSLRLSFSEPPPASGWDVPGDISWFGPADALAGRPGSEAVVQGLCGLMEVHGRDIGRPRRLGIEIASVAAGVLAAQAELANTVGRMRGIRNGPLQTSALQAGLLVMSHYVAAATTGEEPVMPPAPRPGPPFRSRDGRWFEIETLDPEAWRVFWMRLGADEADLGRAWALFRWRYFGGRCSLPSSLHDATARHDIVELAAAADAHGVSLAPLRSYKEVVGQLGSADCFPAIEAAGANENGPAPLRPSEAAPVGAAELPLRGLVVVEATTRMQGPLAGLLLQMLGAHVIKVEPPGGDPGRSIVPLAGDTSSFFSCFNRGKETVELDLRSPSGCDAVRDLVAGADVFLHNWRPGKAEEWQLGADDLRPVKPGLVYVHASGWGGRAEGARLVGTDFLVQAHTALGEALHPVGEQAVPSRVLLTDFMGALVTAEGALHGLYRRERTGRGQRVATSLLAGAMTLQHHVVAGLTSGREVGRRKGRPVWGPLDHPIQTVDGALVVSVEDDPAMRRLGETVGGVDEEAMCRRIAARPAAEWEEVLVDAGIPCSVATSDLTALPRDPRLVAMFEPLAGSAVVPRSPWA